MRVAVGGIYHETNTFVPKPTTLSNVLENHLHTGAAIHANWSSTETEIGGFLDVANDRGWSIAPTYMAWIMPSGMLTAEAFEFLAGKLIAQLSASLPVDGVLLALHGAMVAEGHPDADGEVLKRVRNLVGPDVPVVVTLDPHGNVTAEMVRYADACIAYDTYPHTDERERGREAALLLDRMRREGRRCVMKMGRRPLLAPVLRQSTEESPMREAIAVAHEWEERSGVLCVSVAYGFPYSDVPEAGLVVTAVAWEEALAQEAAESVAEFVWQRREELQLHLPSVEDAVNEALGYTGLTVLMDVGDNIGGGTPGDGTVLLKQLLAAKAANSLVLLADAEAVEKCIAAGVRSRVRLEVGGKSDTLHGSPVMVEGSVRVISDGIFRNIGPVRDGYLEDQGRTVVLDTGALLVVLTARRMGMWNLEQLRSLGIEPARLGIIVVKGAIYPRAAYAPIARKIIAVNTPGACSADFRNFTYRSLRRPIFPLDDL